MEHGAWSKEKRERKSERARKKRFAPCALLYASNLKAQRADSPTPLGAGSAPLGYMPSPILA
ncbi:MAG: hypothetical protein KAV83_00010 [Desulfobacterales bacterium]|nr:hypothetical protein [Desulfobacterales bacterium]